MSNSNSLRMRNSTSLRFAASPGTLEWAYREEKHRRQGVVRALLGSGAGTREWTRTAAARGGALVLGGPAALSWCSASCARQRAGETHARAEGASQGCVKEASGLALSGEGGAARAVGQPCRVLGLRVRGRTCSRRTGAGGARQEEKHRRRTLWSFPHTRLRRPAVRRAASAPRRERASLSWKSMAMSRRRCCASANRLDHSPSALDGAPQPEKKLVATDAMAMVVVVDAAAQLRRVRRLQLPAWHKLRHPPKARHSVEECGHPPAMAPLAARPSSRAPSRLHRLLCAQTAAA